MTNLLKDTLQALKNHGKTPADVRWVQFSDNIYNMPEESFWCIWDEFQAAANFEFDAGYGPTEVCMALKIVGDDWWLERGNYDGSEWWEFKTKPTRPTNHRKPFENDLRYR